MGDDGAPGRESPEEAISSELLLKQYEMLLDAPEDWRRRAATAAGLLSAGAAALLGGLLLSPNRDLPSVARNLSLVAAFFYLLAVLSFLYSATKPPVHIAVDVDTQKLAKQTRRARIQRAFERARSWRKSGDSSRVDDSLNGMIEPRLLAQTIRDEIEIEVKPLRRGVQAGGWFGGLAMAATVGSIASLVLQGPTMARVDITSTELRAELQKRCGKFNASSLIQIDEFTAQTASVTIPRALCGSAPVRVVLPSQDVLIRPDN
ncbi:hypothetical protein [Phycicoccus jejuensis]|uniref:hypothetical protein n=1 Tax=Phycicoccus jejuensis TaxID=367299 RepID=UPI0012F91B35|nr:hypothetical protein [Phycicoccus jejuensis]